MAAKTFLALCASALLVQTISAQCIGNLGNIGYGNGLGFAGNQLLAAENIGYGAGLAAAGLGYGAGLGSCGLSGLGGLNAANLGALPVASSSAIYPNGISVLSENAIEGTLGASGALPLVATVAFEGELPTAGQAAVSAGCGNGNVGILSEGLGYGAGLGGLGYGIGLGNAGLLNAGLANAGLLNAGLAGGIAGLRGVGGCGCGVY